MFNIERNLTSTGIPLENMFIQVPKELLSTLQNLIEKPTHAGYAYYFILINAFLTKYCAYYIKSSDHFITQKDILSFAGIKSSNKINYITKRNGLLHKADLIEYTKDIPLTLISKETSSNEYNLSLFYSSEVKEDSMFEFMNLNSTHSKNYFVAIPQFLTYRDGYPDGTLVEYTNTYRVNLLDFIEIMSISKGHGVINYMALYITDMLKSNKYDTSSPLSISGQYISEKLGISQKTFYKYIKYIEKRKLISVNRGYNSDLQKNMINKYSIF